MEKPLSRIFAPYFVWSKNYKVDGDDMDSKLYHAEQIAKKMLFGFDSTRKVKQRFSKLPKSFSAWTVLPKCLGCNKSISTKEGGNTKDNQKRRLCAECSYEKHVCGQVRLRSEREHSQIKRKNDACWETCNKCQLGDMESARACVAYDCSNFFPRVTSDAYLATARADLEVINNW
jgi:hypothetical protein